MSISLGLGSTRAIAGVGATVAIGWPSRVRRQDAPGGVVPTRTSVLSGDEEQPASSAAQRAGRITESRRLDRGPLARTPTLPSPANGGGLGWGRAGRPRSQGG